MRSIRLSLILCILVLLVASLLVASFLAYREAHLSLDEKQRSMHQLLLAKHKERRRAENDKFNEALLADARNLAGMVRMQRSFPPMYSQSFYPLGILTSALTPHGYLQYPFWAAQSARGRIHGIMVGMNIALRFKHMALPPQEDGQIADYFQIDTIGGSRWRSPSLKNAKLAFAFDPEIFDKSQLVDWRFDDYDLESGHTVRRVLLKFSRFRVYEFPRRSKGKHKHFGKQSKSSRNSRSSSAPSPGWTIYIQAAALKDELDQTLAEFDKELETELALLKADSQESLETVRRHLWLINGITLGAALLGGCLLVHWGLRPVRRLSDAVSRVSEKDFRLPIRTKELPVELQPIANRLAQSLLLLERAFNREKQAAADISHELRTPLAAMMTTLEVALRKPRSAEDYHEILEECQTSGRQMTQLVERMLALARLDAGADHLRPREVDVAKLADQCASLVRPLADVRGLQLAVDHDGSACIKADPDKLREVLTNLLHNAIEYNKPGGSITMSVHRQNGWLQMQVSDTGVGIPPEAKNHIFERFFRQDSSRHADTLHAGIGLALVKGYVDMMGGTITVESTLGEGSTFQIQLPIKNSGSGIMRVEER